MKHIQSDSRQESAANLYLDETMAMVYVGDVYSLVVQQGSAPVPAKEKIKDKAEKPASQDNRDALWPFVR